MGDFNSKVGEERIDNIIGPYGLGEINERGEKLVDWCKQQELVVTIIGLQTIHEGDGPE